MNSFVRHVWYVAAWASEIGTQPLARRIGGTPVVLFRSSQGKVAALEDRCCHRGAPLSLGRVSGDHLQCGYHGMCFDSSGQCIRIPGQEAIPSKARVQSFPVIEQDSLVWIWMGDPSMADASRIIRFERHEDPAWNWRGERIAYAADHLLLYDNLLDLTHVGYVHPHTIGGSEDEHSSGKLEVTRGEDWARGVRWMRNSTPPAAYQELKPFVGRIDRWQVIYFNPGVVTISVAAKDAGTARDEADYDGAYQSHGFHGVTPEAEGSCHYFWSVGIPSSFDRPGLIDRKIELTRITFEEDRLIIESQQARRSEDPSRPLVDVRSDGLGLAARRIWSSLAAREHPQRASIDS